MSDEFSKECLFIGGSQDGRRVHMDNRLNQARIPVMPVTAADQPMPPMVRWKYEVYDREWLSDGVNDAATIDVVFVLRGMSLTDVLWALIAGYKVKEEPCLSKTN